MLSTLKKFILTHEPFRPAHMGNWIRERYFLYYLNKAVPMRAVRTILDGGCGQGHYARKTAVLFPNAEILAVDIATFAEWGTNPPPHVTFRALDLKTLDEHNTRDLIYSVDVLEHIRGNRIVLERFYAALRPNGYLYLAVPCEEAERYIFPKSWFGEFYQWADEEHVGEMRRLPELVTLMKEIGYRIELARCTFGFFGHLSWEIEFLLQRRAWGKRVNILLMPLLKLLGYLDILLPFGEGNNLVIAKKPV